MKTMNLKYNRDFGNYFGTVTPEPYDTGKDHFKPSFRSIYVSSRMKDGGYYVTSSICGQMRLYRHHYWNEAEIGNIFAHGETLKEAITKFRHNLDNLIYNRS